MVLYAVAIFDRAAGLLPLTPLLPFLWQEYQEGSSDVTDAKDEDMTADVEDSSRHNSAASSAPQQAFTTEQLLDRLQVRKTSGDLQSWNNQFYACWQLLSQWKLLHGKTPIDTSRLNSKAFVNTHFVCVVLFMRPRFKYKLRMHLQACSSWMDSFHNSGCRLAGQRLNEL